jgi:hypothetical protein
MTHAVFGSRLKNGLLVLSASIPALLTSGCYTQHAKEIADYHHQLSVQRRGVLQDTLCRDYPPSLANDPRRIQGCRDSIDRGIESDCLHRSQQMDGGPLGGAFVPIVGPIRQSNRALNAAKGRPLDSLTQKARDAYYECVKSGKATASYPD